MDNPFKLSNKVERTTMISLAVNNVGRQKCPPGYTWGPGIRDHYLIHFIVSGSGTYTKEGMTYKLAAGDVFLAYPDQEVSYRASAEDPWSYEWVGFSGADAETILGHTDFSQEHPVLDCRAYGMEVHQALQRINRAFGNSFTDAVSMTGELYLLLSVFARHASRPDKARSPAGENVRRALDYIASRYSYGITVEDIAVYTGVSRSTLFRQFREVLHTSPKEYLDEFRIRRAKALLTETSLSVASVARSAGYENGLYFSSVFRKLTGETPSVFRRKRTVSG
jgi:AraC-like DNA-binding protein